MKRLTHVELNNRRTSDRTFVCHVVFDASRKHSFKNSAWKMLFSGKFDEFDANGRTTICSNITNIYFNFSFNFIKKRNLIRRIDGKNIANETLRRSLTILNYEFISLLILLLTSACNEFPKRALQRYALI